MQFQISGLQCVANKERKTRIGPETKNQNHRVNTSIAGECLLSFVPRRRDDATRGNWEGGRGLLTAIFCRPSKNNYRIAGQALDQLSSQQCLNETYRKCISTFPRSGEFLIPCTRIVATPSGCDVPVLEMTDSSAMPLLRREPASHTVSLHLFLDRLGLCLQPQWTVSSTSMTPSKRSTKL